MVFDSAILIDACLNVLYSLQRFPVSVPRQPEQASWLTVKTAPRGVPPPGRPPATGPCGRWAPALSAALLPRGPLLGARTLAPVGRSRACACADSPNPGVARPAR